MASALKLSAGEHPVSSGLPAVPSATATVVENQGWRRTARALGWVAGGTVLLWLALRALERKLKQQDAEERFPDDESWEIGDEYPYCTEPPAPESITWDLREPVELTVTLLRQLEWKRFEELVCAYYEAVGFAPQPTRTGGRGGVDINLYEPDGHRPKVYVQCKAWVEPGAASKLVHALAAAMRADDVAAGEFVTAGELADGVRATAGERSITMIDGTELVAKFLTLPIEHRDGILRYVTRDDFRTPTCPNCDVKMVIQTADTGDFWRCPNFPGCQRTIKMRAG
jgi:restriction system protein